MPLILSGNVATELAGATFNVDNSCRFNDDDTAWMEKDSSSVAEKKNRNNIFLDEKRKSNNFSNEHNYSQ